MKPKYILTGLLTVASLPAMAQGNQLVNFNNNASFGVGATYQHYKEQVAGRTLDKETGWLPGLNASGSYMSPNSHYFIGGDVFYTGGNTNYTSRYVTSNTNNQIVSGDIKFGKGFLLSNNFLVTPFVTYGHRYWHRGLSYTENYNLNYVGAGVKADYQVSPKVILTAQAMGGSTFANSLDTPSTNVRYNLGNKAIAKASLSANYRMTQHWYAFTRVSYTYFQFGKSSINPQHGTFEPNSTTQEGSVDLGVRYSF